MGSVSIGIIYFGLTIGSFIAPAVIRALGLRLTMALSSIAYVLYIASIVYIVVPAVLAVSLLIGFSAATLQIAQGAFLGHCTVDSNRGLYSGIFMAFNQGANLPGNFISVFYLSNVTTSAGNADSGLVLGWNDDLSPYFSILTAICGAGAVSLLLLRRIDGIADDEELPKGIWETFRETASVAVSSQMRDILPLCFYTGVSQVFWSGMFTRQMSADHIGIAMCILAGGEVCGAVFFGKYLDFLGTAVSAATVVCLQAAALTVAWWANHTQEYVLFYTAAALLGAADNGIFTTSYSILNERFGTAASEITILPQDDCTGSVAVQNSSYAFGAFFALQSIATMIGFFVSPLIVASGSTQSTPVQFLGEEIFVISCEIGAVAIFLWGEHQRKARAFNLQDSYSRA
eukprot:TRINITY_DN14959_c0_g1_i1.p1 TRINITY_DN14959_c0_g1~~TRINITY_DN14959_c0_g1_i1.p1  ORF type:complete len:460 (-),score=73.03 TRINITY_DN14959_c0_g1_i1:216-1421(-)